MSTPIASNIPEGTPWPDLDDGRRVRLEQYLALVDEVYGRPFAALKDTEAAMVKSEPVWSERNQRANYDRIRAAGDAKAARRVPR